MRGRRKKLPFFKINSLPIHSSHEQYHYLLTVLLSCTITSSLQFFKTFHHFSELRLFKSFNWGSRFGHDFIALNNLNINLNSWVKRNVNLIVNYTWLFPEMQWVILRLENRAKIEKIGSSENVMNWNNKVNFKLVWKLITEKCHAGFSFVCEKPKSFQIVLKNILFLSSESPAIWSYILVR